MRASITPARSRFLARVETTMQGAQAINGPR
jgi:hypothetical protein